MGDELVGVFHSCVGNHPCCRVAKRIVRSLVNQDWDWDWDQDVIQTSMVGNHCPCMEKKISEFRDSLAKNMLEKKKP